MAKFIFTINRLTGYFASWLIFFITVITFCDIIGRYFFKFPIAGVFELTELTLAVMVFLSLGYAHLLRSHVRIDFFIARLGSVRRHCVEKLVLILSFSFVCLLTRELGRHTFRLYEAGNVTGVLELPHWPVVLIMTLGSAFYAMAILADILLKNKK